MSHRLARAGMPIASRRWSSFQKLAYRPYPVTQAHIHRSASSRRAPLLRAYEREVYGDFFDMYGTYDDEEWEEELVGTDFRIRDSGPMLYRIPEGLGGEGAQVHIFWDLDNKKIEVVEPSQLVRNIEDTLKAYGTIATRYAVGNDATFDFVPAQVREARQDVREFIRMEKAAGKQGIGEEYRCSYCGQKFKTLDKLRRHFTNLHEREFKKRTRNGTKKGRQKYFEAKKDKFFSAKQDAMFFPKKGNNIRWHLNRCGYECDRVRVKDQAADAKLISKARSTLRSLPGARFHIICLLSDDGGFEDVLLDWKDNGHTAVAVCEYRFAEGFPGADVTLDWFGVQHGLHQLAA